MKQPGRYQVRTLGCKANLYDSQVMEAHLQKQGWKPLTSGSENCDENDSDLFIVNSCTVTNEADRQSRKLAEKLARENPNAKVILTGCGAEVDPKGMNDQTKGLYGVLSNRDKPKFLDLLDKGGGLLGDARGYEEIKSEHPMDREWPLPEQLFLTPSQLIKGESTAASSHRTRAFLKIQEGCNSFCTFCIIPYGRGPSRSLRPRHVLEHIEQWVDQGVKEIVLTGTNLGDYGADWGISNSRGGHALDELVELILENSQLPRLRLSSLDPTEITPELVALVKKYSNFCPHFHVSLQSPHSGVLKKMKRRYGFEQVKESLERIRHEVPSAFVGMDLITGFPGESEEDYQWTKQALEQLPWSRLHVFPYSEREGTPATRIKNSVPMGVRRQRSRELNSLSLQRLESIYQSGDKQIRHVLLETHGKGPDGQEGWISGYSPEYLRVWLRDPEFKLQSNQRVDVEWDSVVISPQATDCAYLGRQIQYN